MIKHKKLKKGWDSNPRYHLVYKDLADLHFKPLSHLSFDMNDEMIYIVSV